MKAENEELSRIVKPILLAGLLLLLLLPIGIFLGVSSVIFTTVFIVHLVIQVWVTALSCNVFLKRVRKSDFGLVYSALFVVFFTLILAQTILPITSKDALIHHLTIPKLWIIKGYIFEIPWHEWSYYPMLVQLGFTGLLSLDLLQLSAFYHFTFLLQLSAVIALFVKGRTEKDRFALWAFLLTLTMPIFQRLAGEPLVDIALALYFAIPFALLVKTVEVKFKGEDVFLSGISLGLALGVKYNAIPAVLFFLAGFILYGVQKKVALRSVFKITAVLCLISLLLFSPWMIKNYIWTDTPIYPFLQTSGAGGIASVSVLAKMSPLEQRHLLYGEGILDIVLIPFRMILNGADNNPTKFDAVLSPLLLFFFASIFWARNTPWALWSIVFSTGYFIFSILTASARTRYLAPISLPVIALTIQSLFYLANKRGDYGKWFVNLCFISHILFVSFYSYHHLSKIDLLPYLLNDGEPEAYLDDHLIEYPAIRFINEQLSTNPNAKIYLLSTGNRFFYFDVPVIGGHFSERTIIKMIRDAGKASDIKQELIAQGVTHLFLHRARTESTFSSALNEKETNLWQEFVLTQIEERLSSSGYSFYEIKSHSTLSQ